MPQLKTIIIRHQKENLKKCSLRGITTRDDIDSYRYPLRRTLPPLNQYITLGLDAPPLSPADANQGLLLIDGTWRLAGRMLNGLKKQLAPATIRSIPPGFQTAYPRRQTQQTTCPDPDAGLASIEALYIAYLITRRDTTGLLDHYLWAQDFLTLNKAPLAKFSPI